MKFHTKEINRVVVHHSASDPRRTTVEDVKRWHVDERGWDSIGYHFIISGLGMTEHTRPLHYQGAHTLGHNDGTIGVCVLGDNTKSELRWERYQMNALLDLWGHLRRVYRELDVYGHRDLVDGTECPGIDIRAMLLGPRYKEKNNG